MITKKMKLPDLLKAFGKTFSDAGFKAYLVGGAVRDMIMKVPAHDWDVATNATPQDVIKLFKFVVPTGTNQLCWIVIAVTPKKIF